MYKLIHNSDTVIRLADNAFIPADNGNRDWREYQEWLAAGNTPQAADIPPLAPVTNTDDLLAIIENLRERIALLEGTSESVGAGS